jgi:hypothetical protein
VIRANPVIRRGLSRVTRLNRRKTMKPRSFCSAFAALIALAAFSAQAQAGPLSGEEIKNLIGGKRVYLSTPLRIELPLYYKSNGTVVGNISGFSFARLFTPKESGRWWIQGSRLCQKWPTWYKGRQFCFTISKIGETKISWTREDNYSGTARIEN